MRTPTSAEETANAGLRVVRSRSKKQEFKEPVPASVVGVGIYISQAAQMVGTSPMALRTWERQGLIEPRRTASGYRLYTMTDIERMQKIQALSGAGVNAAGVRRLLDDTSNMSAPKPVPAAAGEAGPPRSVGHTLRELRNSRGLSLRDLSALTGLSASYISSVERDIAAPSIASLQKLAAAFDRNVLGLMTDSYEAPDVPVVRRDSRRILDSHHGVRIEDMSTAQSNLEPLLFTFQPGGGSDGAVSHEGEEFCYVISGQLHIRLDGSDDYLLDPGDSMSYRSERAHQFDNPGTTPTVVLWINTPRTF